MSLAAVAVAVAVILEGFCEPFLALFVGVSVVICHAHRGVTDALHLVSVRNIVNFFHQSGVCVPTTMRDPARQSRGFQRRIVRVGAKFSR